MDILQLYLDYQLFMVLLMRVNSGYHALFKCMKGLGMRIAYILACSSLPPPTHTQKKDI